VDASGIKKGVTGGTGAGSKGAGGTALSASEGERMERYFAMLIARLREGHEKPGGLSDLLNAEVRFTVAANGTISGVQIVRSSGNADFDQSVLEAFTRVKMPARPDGKTDVQQVIFRIKEA
jgi:colicin import membrane protein